MISFRPRLALLLVPVALLSACRSTEKDGPSEAEVQAALTPPWWAEDVIAGLDTLSDRITVPPAGLDRYPIGMLLDDFAGDRLGGLEFVPTADSSTCAYALSEQTPFGLLPVFRSGILVRQDFAIPDFGDEYGLGYVSSMSAIRQAYGDRVQITDVSGRPGEQTALVLGDDGVGTAFHLISGRVAVWSVGFNESFTEPDCAVGLLEARRATLDAPDTE